MADRREWVILIVDDQMSAGLAKAAGARSALVEDVWFRDPEG